MTVATPLLFGGCLRTRAQMNNPDQIETQAAAPDEGQPAQAPQRGGYELDEIKNEITHLTGRIEELERSKDENSKENKKSVSQEELKAELKKIQNQLSTLEEKDKQFEDALSRIKNAPVLGEIPELFEKGKTKYHGGDFEGAIASFTAYLKNPRVKNAQEAYYLRGESQFALKQYKQAVTDFSKIYEDFPSSKFMAQSILKLAQSLEALGHKEEAKGLYQECADKFPKTSEGKKAKSKLR